MSWIMFITTPDTELLPVRTVTDGGADLHEGIGHFITKAFEPHRIETTFLTPTLAGCLEVVTVNVLAVLCDALRNASASCRSVSY